MNLEQRILGIDPGSRNLGLAFIIQKGQSCHVERILTLTAKPSDPLYQRIRILKVQFNEAFESFNPSEVAIENIFLGQNPKSIFSLGLLRGVILSTCFDRDLEIHEYSPAQVKMAVTGRGNADKVQIQKMLGLLFKKQWDEGFDATDALAVAFCHASHSKLKGGP